MYSYRTLIINGCLYYYRLNELITLTETAFSEIGADRWRGACEHVEKEISRMQQQDNYMSNLPGPSYIIHLEDDTTDTASEGESDYDTSHARASKDSESTDTASEGEL